MPENERNEGNQEGRKMISVFYGSDRKKISKEIEKILGEDYEVFYGNAISVADLPNIFLGQTIFENKRRILIKDVTPARGETSLLTNTLGDKNFYEIAEQYLDSPHEIVIWETTVCQKKCFKNFLKNQNVNYRKYDLVKDIDLGKVFRIYDIALADGPGALKLLEEVKEDEDPFMFVGLLSNQAIRAYERKQGKKEKRVLLELSKLDINMKTTSFDPWLLISSFLLQLSSL